MDYWISGAKHRVQQYYSGIGLGFFNFALDFFGLVLVMFCFALSFRCLEETSVPIEQHSSNTLIKINMKGHIILKMENGPIKNLG